MFKAAGFAEQEGVSAGPRNATRRNFLGIISVTGALGVPPAAYLLPCLDLAPKGTEGSRVEKDQVLWSISKAF